jgi:hypothetical protein
MNLSSCITLYIESQQQIWNVIQYNFFHVGMFSLDNQSIFFDFKISLLLANEFLINK